MWEFVGKFPKVIFVGNKQKSRTVDLVNWIHKEPPLR